CPPSSRDAGVWFRFRIDLMRAAPAAEPAPNAGHRAWRLRCPTADAGCAAASHRADRSAPPKAPTSKRPTTNRYVLMGFADPTALQGWRSVSLREKFPEPRYRLLERSG